MPILLFQLKFSISLVRTLLLVPFGTISGWNPLKNKQFNENQFYKNFKLWNFDQISFFLMIQRCVLHLIAMQNAMALEFFKSKQWFPKNSLSNFKNWQKIFATSLKFFNPHGWYMPWHAIWCLGFQNRTKIVGDTEILKSKKCQIFGKIFLKFLQF